MSVVSPHVVGSTFPSADGPAGEVGQQMVARLIRRGGAVPAERRAASRALLKLIRSGSMPARSAACVIRSLP